MTRTERREIIKAELERWVFLLGLEGWTIRWQAVKTLGPWRPRPPYNDAVIWVNRPNRSAFVRISLAHATSRRKIQRTVTHELQHIFEDTVENNTHQMIRIMSIRLVMVAERAGRVI